MLRPLLLRVGYSAVLLGLVLLSKAGAQSRRDDCIACQRPAAFNAFTDSVMDVQMADGSVIRNVQSIGRTTVGVLGSPEQAIRITWKDGGMCRDSLVVADAVVGLLHEGLGGTHSPLRYPVAPAREILRSSADKRSASFLEVLGQLGYGGTDTTSRAIGFSSLYEGIEAIVAPLGDWLGEFVSLGVGGGVMFEGGRMRFPLYGELRLNWPGSEKLEVVTKYYPDSCEFADAEAVAADPPWTEFSERPRSRTDKTVFFTRDRSVVRSPFRPYLYLDAGTIFDGNFDGAGTPDNAVNPELRKPLLLGAGIGHPIGDSWTIALGYRYMQLHLATPCPQCVDRTIINRNTVHSVTLRGGWRMEW